jgi:hypothetical protein
MNPMIRTRLLTLTLLVALATLMIGLQASLVAAKGPAKVLAFDTMVGVPSAFTGAQNPIRGINGGGVPWVIGSGSGELTTSGHLEIKVEGLVLASTGSNPSATFRGIVSCLGSDAGVQNLTTDPFPATLGPASEGGGNASIEADLSLPQPCIAPIVFVASAGGSWFASTGS